MDNKPPTRKPISVNRVDKLEKELNQLQAADSDSDSDSEAALPLVRATSLGGAAQEAEDILSECGIVVSKRTGCVIQLLPPIFDNDTSHQVTGIEAVIERTNNGWYVKTLNRVVCLKRRHQDARPYTWRMKFSPAALKAWDGCHVWPMLF